MHHSHTYRVIAARRARHHRSRPPRARPARALRRRRRSLARSLDRARAVWRWRWRWRSVTPRVTCTTRRARARARHYYASRASSPFPFLASPCLTLPRLASPRLASPRLASPRLNSTRFGGRRLSVVDRRSSIVVLSDVAPPPPSGTGACQLRPPAEAPPRRPLVFSFCPHSRPLSQRARGRDCGTPLVRPSVWMTAHCARAARDAPSSRRPFPTQNGAYSHSPPPLPQPTTARAARNATADANQDRIDHI